MSDADKILEVMAVGEPYTAREIANELAVSRRTADRRLRELAAENKIRRKKHSKRRVTWWREE